MAISRTEAIHLLRRSGFHSRPADIAQLMTAANWEAAVDRILGAAPPSPAPPLAVPPEVSNPAKAAWDLRVELMKWWLERMRTTSSPIVEKLAFFFHAFHFPGSLDKKTDAVMAFKQIDLFRRHALGDYHQLAQAVAVDPWMLHYLDNGTNRAPGAINENFGRELLELFLLGRDGYAEVEVREMSRAWSGHNLGADGASYVFDASAHDTGPKTIFGITKNWNGPEALTEALTGSKAVPTSKFFVAKLWRFFAGTEAAPAVLDALAAEFRASGLSLRALVRAIFLRPEFRSVEVRQGRVVTPVEWFVGLTAALGIPAGVAEPQWWIPAMGMDVLRAPNPSGWPQGRAWLTGSAWWKRGECARWLAYKAVAQPYNVLPQISSSSTPAAVTDAVSELFGTDLGPASRKVFTDWAAPLSGAWHGGSMRALSIVLFSLSPEFNVG